MHSYWKSVLLLLLVSSPVAAQNYPMPGSASEPPVLCTGCPVGNGLPTFPYDKPLSVHVGRFVDSAFTQLLGSGGMRTVRSGLVRAAPSVRNRVYLQLGGTIGGYALDTFFTQKLQESMVPVNTLPTGISYSGRSPYPYEQLAKPHRYFYPEAAYNHWDTPLYDSYTSLNDFDADDRGFVYLGMQYWGWGIASDPGDTAGTYMPAVKQIPYDSRPVMSLLSLRNGSTYYVLYSTLSESGGSGRAHLYDVTTPVEPAFVAERFGTDKAFSAWSKHEASSRLALVLRNGRVAIYTYAQIIAGSGQLAELVAAAGRRFYEVSFDESGNLWVLDGATSGYGGFRLQKLTPSGESYTTTTFDFSDNPVWPLTLHASAGYLAVGARVSTGGLDVRLLRIVDGVPQLLDLNQFYARYYTSAPEGYTKPFYWMEPPRGYVMAQNGKTYLFLISGGLGDVFEISDADRITSIAPKSGIPAGGTNVSIYGSGFTAGSTVTFDGTLASSTFVSATKMTAIAPMHAPGSVNVVVSPPGSAPMTAPKKYTYELLAPKNFTATADGTTSVALTWNAVEGATYYEVSRRSPSYIWEVIGTPSGTSFNDGERTEETTYLYRVRALDAAANGSPYVTDYATTMTAELQSITAGMPIRARDIELLRQRVNAMCTAAGQPHVLPNGGHEGDPILATNVQELRSAVHGARLALGAQPVVFLGSIAPGAKVYAATLNQLLDLLR